MRLATSSPKVTEGLICPEVNEKNAKRENLPNPYVCLGSKNTSKFQGHVSILCLFCLFPSFFVEVYKLYPYLRSRSKKQKPSHRTQPLRGYRP